MEAVTTNLSEFDNPYPKDQVVATLRCLLAGYKKLGLKIMDKQMEQMRKDMQLLDPREQHGVREAATDRHLDFQTDLDEVEKTVFSQNSIDDPAKFQKSCDITYKDDHIVSHLVKRRSKNVELILKGRIPHNDGVELPPEMTPEHTMNVICKVQGFLMTNLLNLAEELLNKGESVSEKNPELKSAFQKTRVDELRAKIFKELGMDQFLDCPEEILQKAIQTYAFDRSNSFGNKMEEFEAKTSEIMMAVMNGKVDLQNIQEYRDKVVQLSMSCSEQDAPLKSEAQNTEGDSVQPST